MKTISRMELKEGMELAEPVEAAGRVIFNCGTKVTQAVIDKLEHYDVIAVTIMENVDYAKTHNERIQFDKDFQFFKQKYNDCLTRYKGIMLSYLGTNFSIPTQNLIDIFNDCYSAVKSEKQLLDFIYNMMPNEDELTYTQSFNAALLCGAFANWLTLPEDKKRTLILCGFYYDIGKWKIPTEILWKPGKLSDSEFALVKQHTLIGYKLVMNDTALSDDIKKCILMHHEKMDGSGYPVQLKGDKINEYARYLSIVDTYIAMASPRAFRPAFTPLQIIGSFEKSIEKYDSSILMPLIERISEAQIGTTVQLNDGTEWEVMLINKNPYSRPTLRNLGNMILNLAERPDLEIVKLI
ncbi:MAG: HD domain-containing protein [Lachnospiraceae bacterium]|nr:HD domain-containing protein [Lachnospiraceae bacterium]